MKRATLAIAALAASPWISAQSTGERAVPSSSDKLAATVSQSVVDPLANIQGDWLGSSGEPTRPPPFEFSVRGRQVFVTAHREPAFKSIAPIGEIQAELVGEPDVILSPDERVRSFQFNGRCYDGLRGRLDRCHILVNHHIADINAPKNSWTFSLTSFGGSKVYRQPHWVKLRESYSRNFRGWD